MLNQENIRERLNYMINTYFSNQTKIAKELGVSLTTVNKFRSGNQNLSDELLMLFDKFLKERGI